MSDRGRCCYLHCQVLNLTRALESKGLSCFRDKNRGARSESPGKSPRIGYTFLMSLGSFQAWASDSSRHLQCVSSWLERSKCSPGALSLPPDCTNKHLLAGSSWWHRCWVENTTGDQSAEELEVLSKESPEKLPAQQDSQCHPRCCNRHWERLLCGDCSPGTISMNTFSFFKRTFVIGRTKSLSTWNCQLGLTVGAHHVPLPRTQER